jgi:hypothetical protein
MAPRWTERHKAVAASRRRLAELAERARGGVLPEAEGWERASLVLDLDGAAAAEPLLREVVERSPNHAGAHWVLGEILLARNDARGVSLIERAVDIDPSARGAGYDAIRRFYERRGEEELAARYERQAWEERDLFTLAEQERRGVSPSDEFAPHALPAEAVAAIREALARIDQVAEAYLGQKVMRYYSEDRLYVLGVRFRISWYKFRSQEWTRRLLQRIGETVPVPGQWFVIALEGDGKKIGDKLRALAGACVYGAGSLTTAAPRVNDAPPDLRPATPTPSQDDVPPELATPASAGVGVLDAFRVLWSPGALFERLRDRPRILMPMITIMILTLIIGLLSRPYVAASIVARAPDAVDPGGTATGQAILVALGMPIIALQLAFFLWLTVNLTGTATRYPALLSVQTHVMIVFILQWTAGLVLLMIRGVDGITAQTDLRPAFGLDLLMPPARGYLEAVLREVGVFAIWSVVLLGIGISKTHDASRKTGYVAAGAAFVATLAQLALDAWLARR